MSRTVRCEQVVLGWSHYSLLGGDGFGPVFASAGWPLPPGDRDAGLGEHARFLSELYLGRDQLDLPTGRSTVEELPAISSPHGLTAAVDRDLDFDPVL